MSVLLAACGGAGASNSGEPGTLTVSLSTSTVIAAQDGTPGQISVSATGTNAASPVSFTATGLPGGVAAQFTPGSSPASATMTVTAGAAVPAGTYSSNVVASSGNQTGSQSFTLVIAIAASVMNTTDTSLGVNGKLQQFMSTSFQPAEWDYKYFQNHSTTEPAQLSNLGAQHIRLQGLSQAVPMKANTGLASDWDFSILDGIVQPVLGVGDNSPQFQIAVAPSFLNDANGHLIFTMVNLTAFADYSANLVRYYNRGGFTWGGRTFVSPSYPQRRITWWGIFNEYNLNGLTPSQYVQLYNTVVPAMLAVDPTLKFSALELAADDPTKDLPTFVAPPASGGVNTQVDVAATHFYPTCNQKDTDAVLFERTTSFVQYLQYFYQQLRTRTDLSNVAVWVTETNVNSDFPVGNGMSDCTPGQRFVLDPRGTSAFFAAWRPYVFSQFGKAGNRALYHWDYDADAQYGEVDYTTGKKYLSYWVDYWLGQMFPSTPTSPGPDVLRLAVTETSSAEVLASKNSDGSVVVMVVDRAVRGASDNNGPGDPRTVIVDVSGLGVFSRPATLTVDAKTDPSSGPASAPITPAPKMTVALGGYGVTFLKLKP